MNAPAARPRRERSGWRIAVAAVLALAVALTTAPAHAATTSRWADWTFGGSAGAFTGSVQLADLPALAATFASDSRGGQVGLISGASTWLGEGTPVGAKYGSSRDLPYLNLRPRADTASGASLTTYSFATPTPVSGWSFTLGDIDADQVAIRAVGPDGVELPAAALGFRGGFNYCAPGVVGKPSCTGSAADVPTWNAATRTLTGNSAAADTSGAAAWFEPTQPISSLTFAFTRRAGFPVYQTWFAALARDVAGTVSHQGGGATVAGAVVRLLDARGAQIASASTDGSGAYTFPGVTATSGYTVEVVPPAGTVAVGPARAPADLTTTDAVVPFVIRDIVPVPVSGFVRDTLGAPIGGAQVSLSNGADTLTTETASDGSWLIDAVPVGVWQPTVTPPSGYSVTASPGAIEVPDDSEQPVEQQNFLLAADPTLSGRVATGAAGVGGVTVTAASDAGAFSTVTAGDGSYAFPRIPGGEYVVSVTEPPGYTAPVRTQTIELVADATLDFALEPARTGAVTGTVSADGAPLAGVAVSVGGTAGSIERATDADGAFSVDGLAPGTYTVVVTVPDGFEPTGATSQLVTITGDGESVAVSFALAALAADPSPAPPAQPAATVPPGGTLPATGGPDPAPGLITGATLLAMGLIAATTARAVRGVRRRP